MDSLGVAVVGAGAGADRRFDRILVTQTVPVLVGSVRHPPVETGGYRHCVLAGRFRS
jgi:hypothetical protein